MKADSKIDGSFAAALFGLVGGLVLVGPAALALGGGRAEPGAPVLVVTAPWADPAAAVRAAGGRVIALVDAPMATLGLFPDAASLARARREGSWLFDGRRAAALCGADA